MSRNVRFYGERHSRLVMTLRKEVRARDMLRVPALKTVRVSLLFLAHTHIVVAYLLLTQ